jgi:hypothetical protein
MRIQNRLVRLAAIVLLVALPLCIGAAGPASPTIGHDARVLTGDTHFEVGISGPTEVPAGFPVFLDGTGVDNLNASWRVFPAEAAKQSFRARMVYRGVVDGKPQFGHEATFATPIPGVYHFVLAAAKGDAVGLAVHTVTVTGNKPEPDPEPNPDPEPSPDPFPSPSNIFVLVVQESGERTAKQTAAMHGLHLWLDKQGIKRRTEDPDLRNKNDEYAKWLQPYKEAAAKAGIAGPGLVTGVVEGGVVKAIQAVPLPETSSAAIEAVKARFVK